MERPAIGQHVYVLYPFVSGFGGIERLILDLAHYLQQNGQVLVLLTFRNAVDFSVYGASNLHVELISSRRNLLAEVVALQSFLHRKKICSDRVLVLEMRGAMYAGVSMESGYSVQISDPPSLLSNDISKWSFSLAARYAGGNSLPGFGTRVRGQIVHWLTRRGIRRARNLITMTQRNVEELSWVYGVDVVKIPQGVRLPVQQRLARTGSSSDVVFLSVCRLETSKRVDAIIRCFAETLKAQDSERRAGFRLRIVGEGSQELELKRLAVTCGVAEAVEFFGLVTDDLLERIYAESDIFVMPARQGYGLPGLECLVRGLCLIVHKESGVTEQLENTPRVQVVDDSGVSLTTAMIEAARNLDSQTHETPVVPTSSEWASAVSQLCGWSQV
jgi:glycosyltransferase involved in cell wall biosynthesis